MTKKSSRRIWGSDGDLRFAIASRMCQGSGKRACNSLVTHYEASRIQYRTSSSDNGTHGQTLRVRFTNHALMKISLVQKTGRVSRSGCLFTRSSESFHPDSREVVEADTPHTFDTPLGKAVAVYGSSTNLLPRELSLGRSLKRIKAPKGVRISRSRGAIGNGCISWKPAS